jgi:hypothetical protein
MEERIYLTVIEGSMKEIYDKDGWAFHKDIAAKCGSINNLFLMSL